MFGDSSGASLGLPGSTAPSPSSGESPSLGEGADASTGGTDSPTVPGNVASSISNSNTIFVEDDLVSFAFSGESSAPAVRGSDAEVETSSANIGDNNVSNSKEDLKGINGSRGVQSESRTEAAGSVEVADQAGVAALDSVNPGISVSTHQAEDDDRGNMTIKGTPFLTVSSEIS